MNQIRLMYLVFAGWCCVFAAAHGQIVPLNAKQQIPDWWLDMSGPDAAQAYQAMWKFVDHPEPTMAFLRKRLAPVQAVPDDKTFARIVRDLGDDNFQVRSAARESLEKLGELAEPALRKALAGKLAFDTEQILTRLLKNLDGPAATSEQLAQLRALEILEKLDSADARKLLHELARGTPQARLTIRAKESLSRLQSARPAPVASRRNLTGKDLFGDPLPAQASLRLGTTRLRHSYLAAFHPDGKTLASVSPGGLHLWDLADGKELRSLADKRLPCCLSMVHSADGRYLAMNYQSSLDGVQEHNVDVWDCKTDRLIQHIGLKQDGVTLLSTSVMAFSADAKLIYFGTDTDLHVIDVASGTEKDAFSHAIAGERPPGVVVVSPHGRYMLTGSGGERVVHLWDVKARKKLHDLDNGAHDVGMVSTMYSPDEKWLAIGNSDGIVKIHDSATGQLVHLFHGATKAAGLAFSPDGQTLAVAENDRFRAAADAHISLWNLHKPRDEPRRFAAPDVRWLLFSPDGKTLAWGCWENTVMLMDVAAGKEKLSFAGHQGAVQTVVYSPSGKYIATGSTDHTARLWNAQTGKPLRVFQGHTAKVNAVALSGDDRWMATAGGDGSVFLWDVADGKKKLHLRSWNSAYAVQFSPDGKYLLASGINRSFRIFDGSVRVFDLAGGAEVKVFDRNTTTYCLAFSGDGTQLAMGGTRAVWVRDFATGKLLYQFETGEIVTSLAFSSDGRTLAAGSEKTTRLWEVLTKAERGTFAGHGIANWVAYAGIALSPNGRVLASASCEIEAGLTHVWNLADGKVVGPWRGHWGHVNGVAFAPDGARLATAGADGTVLIWDMRGRK